MDNRKIFNIDNWETSPQNMKEKNENDINAQLKKELEELKEGEIKALERKEIMRQIRELKHRKWVRENPTKARIYGFFSRSRML